ncbi:MAG: GntR family transcriptional regulator [Planctomycetes bacterium]|nr:GntR family transcriptional regulator [Planctomycetota bacterium]
MKAEQVRDVEQGTRVEEIVSDIRGKILRGDLTPGEQLPIRLDLSEQYGASSRTLQEAVDHLMEQGFLKANRRHGTFVAPHPPHMSRYGLVFPFSRSRSNRSRHWLALKKVAEEIEDPPEFEIHRYFGMEKPSDAEDYQTLISDIEQHRLAGLIFSSPPYALSGTPVLEWKGLPRVEVASKPQRPHVSCVKYDNETFLRKALGYFKERGCARLGIFDLIKEGDALTPRMQAICQAAPEYGLRVKDPWVVGGAVGASHFTKNTIRLLMHLPTENRPDALLIGDDNLAKDVTEAIAASPVKVPEDLDIVCHANFPCPPPTAVPAHKVGYRMDEVIDVAIRHINALRRGDEDVRTIKILAKTEGEVENAVREYHPVPSSG